MTYHDPNYQAPEGMEPKFIHLDGCDCCGRQTADGRYLHWEGEAWAFCSHSCREAFWRLRRQAAGLGRPSQGEVVSWIH